MGSVILRLNDSTQGKGGKGGGGGGVIRLG